MHLGLREPRDAAAQRRDYGTDFHTAFAIKQQRQQFQAQPPQLQRETLARVLRLLEAERRRRPDLPRGSRMSGASGTTRAGSKPSGRHGAQDVIEALGEDQECI